MIFFYQRLTLKSLRKISVCCCILLSFICSIFLAENSYAFNANIKQSPLPSVLKADSVDADQANNSLSATGNVEVSKGSSVVYSDKVFYDKDKGLISATGDVRVKNIEIGNVRAIKAEIKDDFSSGDFFSTTLVLNDGSYLKSPKIERQTPQITHLRKSIYSICPNPFIGKNNKLAGKKRDMLSIKSKNITIDRGEEVFKIRGGVVRLYNVPFFYTPYLSAPLPSNERKSGFLHPSYTKNTRLGIGIKIPYYFAIAENKELTVTPNIHPNNNQLIINNEFHHLTSYGEYSTSLEIANNKIEPSTNVTDGQGDNSEYRWRMRGEGKFDFTKNTGLDFEINATSDKSYLRDYYNGFRNYNLSKVNLDYINGRQYHAVKAIRIQEYENIDEENNDPLILPVLDSHIETKPLFYKEKFSLTSNMTVISRDGGEQYRRVTTIPEVNLPVNFKGNLFNFNSKVQGDFYSLENNFKNSYPDNNYNSVQTNYKPEFSASWRIPLLKKMKSSTIIIEPMANFVSSSYKRNFKKIPNEDSNSNELTMSNLFVADRISGFDRNESGERISYGAKTSLFNSHGEYGLTAGQSFKRNGNVQDVSIRGFNNNNKSNIVGMLSYKSPKYFYTSYSFHLNESDYRNEINEVLARATFKRFQFTGNYLFLRENSQNTQEIEQLNLSSDFKFTEKYSANFILSRDMITGRNINRTVGFLYNGCCTVFGLSMTQSNPSDLVKPQKSFNMTLSFKNL